MSRNPRSRWTSCRWKGLLALVAALAATVVVVPGFAGTAGRRGPAHRGPGQRQPDGSTGTVRGYVVGQPTATDTVVRSGFPNDYAMALADSAGDDEHLVDALRAAPGGVPLGWGLRTNPRCSGSRSTSPAR